MLFKLRIKNVYVKHKMNYIRKDGYKANASKSGMIMYNEYKEEH